MLCASPYSNGTTEEDARKAQAALKAAQEAAQAAEKSIAAAAAEKQENGAQIENASPVNKVQGNTAKTNGSGTKPVVKKKVKPKMTAKERKERNVCSLNVLFLLL